MKYMPSVFCVVLSVFNTTYASLYLVVSILPVCPSVVCNFFSSRNLFTPSDICDVTLGMAARTN